MVRNSHRIAVEAWKTSCRGASVPLQEVLHKCTYEMCVRKFPRALPSACLSPKKDCKMKSRTRKMPLRTHMPTKVRMAAAIWLRVRAEKNTPMLTKPAPVKVVSDAKEMLQVALEAEIETIGRYVQRRKEAEAAQEYGLVADFDQVIADETKHRDELQQMLARWP